MDSALGAPEKLKEVKEDLPPMMSQYFEICKKHDDSIVLFHVGDFYKAFCEVAEKIARICELSIATRKDSTGEYRMTGIRIENAESYIEKLLDSGYKVAIAEQVEDPEKVKGVAERSVTKIITPGTLTEDELLKSKDNNFIACLTKSNEKPSTNGKSKIDYGLAFLDISTGDFYSTKVNSEKRLYDEINRFKPSEAIIGPNISDLEKIFNHDFMVTNYDKSVFNFENSKNLLKKYFNNLDSLHTSKAEIRACGSLLAYAEYTKGVEKDGGKNKLNYLNYLKSYDSKNYMLLDATARDSLELFEKRSPYGSENIALIDVLDNTACALGSRKLRSWLRRPLCNKSKIEARFNAVEEWINNIKRREKAHDLLYDVYDIERLISRVSRKRANARDLRSLKVTLDIVPKIKNAMENLESERLMHLESNLNELKEIRELIEKAIVEDPPTEITEGGIIKKGYDEKLDELLENERKAKEWIDSLEKKERNRTGIDSLEVGHNSIHGYYIEITDSNLDKIPENYVRRQTLKNSERFYTPDLKEKEDDIINAEKRANDLEYKIFCNIREKVASKTKKFQELADCLAEIDALISLAEVAIENDYSRPTISNDIIDINKGRHPVVEKTQNSFVPNGIKINEKNRFAIITGPNMSGKSTYMRQIALIVILAQIGSFVPAKNAEISIVDRIFTRVGASDDIASGKSTFMIEMDELSEILESATEDSLVILDEIGRGTSTTDGYAIAHAVTEFINKEINSKTLFATHHHDLTNIEKNLNKIFNLHFDADREGEKIEFDHDLQKGASSSSYGVDVAKLAGLPDSVVKRSREILEDKTCKNDKNKVIDTKKTSKNNYKKENYSNVLEEIEKVNIANITPIEALNIINEIKKDIQKSNK